MNFLSLFAGIGGIDLGLERAGMTCVGQVEIDPKKRWVLTRQWPNVPRFDDVRTFNPEVIGERVDLVAGGFPCQDISPAGKRAGIGGERSGLWSEMRRIISECRPRFAVVENSSALARMGLSVVLGDLARLGFNAEWSVVPACAVGAPHPRKRMFVVAYAPCERWEQRWRVELKACRDPAGDLHHWKDQPEPPRVADGVPGRVDRNAWLGDAVVPQVAEWIGRRILQAHNQQPLSGATR